MAGRPDPLSLAAAGADALTFRSRETGRCVTVYREDKPAVRVRWTLAHELGHVLLRHLEWYESTRLDHWSGRSKVLEAEADVFATELLSPPALLRLLGAIWSEDIARVCGISSEAALYRERDLQKGTTIAAAQIMEPWYRERFADYLSPVAICANPADIGPLHRLAIHRSEVGHVWRRPERIRADAKGRFVDCPRCGFSGFSSGAAYCRICGLHLYNVCTRGPMLADDHTCAALNPPDAMFCEHCGHPTLLLAQGLIVHPDDWQVAKREVAATGTYGCDEEQP